MSIPIDELLKPSLSLTRATKAPYSVQVTFLTAFFGGPFAIFGITALNAWRLGRLMRDAVPLLIVLAAFLGFVWTLVLTEWGATFYASMPKPFGPQTMHYFYRLLALILCGLGYLLHRNEQRNADVMALERPNGWIGGLGFIVGGNILAILQADILTAIGGA